MPGTTYDIDSFFVSAGLKSGPQHLAAQITQRHTEWNNARTLWLNEKLELRNYLFATDTTSTSNSRLPWKNSTTIPKLTQIRDNLHANYMFALFPNDDWLRWEGTSREDEFAKKRKAIESYISTKLREDNAQIVLSQCLLDYIDYGNCFATTEWVNESFEDQETGEITQGYIGPRIVRISPYDITFNPLASSFSNTPKIVRNLMSLGELARKIKRLPEGDYKTNLKEILNNSVALRKRASNFDQADRLRDESFRVDGFGDFLSYLESDYIEILTFYGNIYDQENNELKENHIIEVIDRAFIARDEPNPEWKNSDLFHHAGWRQRPDSLYAMGPLDNLVGMQYRIDHLENLKADVFDLIAFPVQKVRGFVEDYTYEPGAKIFVGDDGDVDFMRPDAIALNADTQIADLQRKMEELAGAPREAMGIRSPGEKTKFEVQLLDNAASRLFLNKVKHFEKVFLEPLLNDMLALARRNMQASDIVRSTNRKVDAVIFSTVTKDDITARGTLRPRGASHFAQRANQLQNILSLLNSPAFSDPSISVHLSGKKLAKLIEELSDLDDFEIFGENIRVLEQGETQQLAMQTGEQAEVAAMTPPGIVDADVEGIV